MQTREDLPLWARAADAATIALLFLALFVALEGGFVFWPNGLRISVRSEWRPLGWALALLVARHLLVREAPIHRRFISRLDAAARAPGPLRDDTPPVAEPGAPRPIRWKRVLTYTIYGALVVLLYAVLTAVMTYPQITRMSDTVAVNDGDPLFSTWRLAWVAHQLPRDPAHLFNANIFYPERLTLAFSDSMLVTGLMAAPLFWLGVPQLMVYNIMLLASFALSGASMFLLVRSLTHNNGAAFVAGFIFAFLPYRFMHYSHLELQVSHWMPLCLWALHRTIRHGRRRRRPAHGPVLRAAVVVVLVLRHLPRDIPDPDRGGAARRRRRPPSAGIAARLDRRRRARRGAGAAGGGAVLLGPRIGRGTPGRRDQVLQRDAAELPRRASPERRLRQGDAPARRPGTRALSRLLRPGARADRVVAAAVGAAHRLRARTGAARSISRSASTACSIRGCTPTRCRTAACVCRRAWR